MSGQQNRLAADLQRIRSLGTGDDLRPLWRKTLAASERAAARAQAAGNLDYAITVRENLALVRLLVERRFGPLSDRP